MDLILGKGRNGGSGQYIRYAGQPAVYLIPEKIWLDTKNEEWLNKIIVDIDGEKLVKNMSLKHAGKAFGFMRKTAETNWKPTKSGKSEKLNQAEVTSLGNILKDLYFSKIVPVRATHTKTEQQKLVYFSAELFDGRIINLTLGDRKDKNNNIYDCAAEMDLRKDVTDDSLTQEVQVFNRRAKPWLYTLNSWQGGKFFKKRADFNNKEKK